VGLVSINAVQMRAHHEHGAVRASTLNNIAGLFSAGQKYQPAKGSNMYPPVAQKIPIFAFLGDFLIYQ
jgi:hypothetical protein